MVESCDIPDQMAKTRQSGYGTDRLSLLTDVIGQYALRYGCLDTRVLYVWTPTEALSESELACAYALQYVSLFLHRDVASFIVDFSANAVGAGLDVGQLYRLISVIDTQEGDTALASVCTALRIEDLTDLFPDYRAGMLQERRTVQTSLSDAGYAEGRVPIGSYDLWDFSDATGTMGWYAGNACGELAVLGRALNAPFSPIGAGGFADMAYHFTSGRDLSVAPLLRMQIGVDGEADTPYEVQIRMIGAGVSVTAFAVLTAGDAQQLYLDLTESASLLTSVQCIRIAARPLNNSDKPFTVRLQSVTLESVILTSAELAERMEADGAGDPNGADGNKNGIATRAVIVTVLVIGVSIAFACMLIVLSRHHGRVTVTAERSDNEEKKEKKKDKDDSQEGEAAPSEQEAAANRSENNKGRIKQ
jgi:hypothetical protein